MDNYPARRRHAHTEPPAASPFSNVAHATHSAHGLELEELQTASTREVCSCDKKRARSSPGGEWASFRLPHQLLLAGLPLDCCSAPSSARRHDFGRLGTGRASLQHRGKCRRLGTRHRRQGMPLGQDGTGGADQQHHLVHCCVRIDR
jgi:hypothetical protein